MTGTNCDLFTHKESRSYLNHLVIIILGGAGWHCNCYEGAICMVMGSIPRRYKSFFYLTPAASLPGVKRPGR